MPKAEVLHQGFAPTKIPSALLLYMHTVPCPADCTECDAVGCCTGCSAGYEVDNCACNLSELVLHDACCTVLLVVVKLTNSFRLVVVPPCQAPEGCKTCTLDVSGRACCSECDTENSFNLDGCDCFKGECVYEHFCSNQPLIKDKSNLLSSKMRQNDKTCASVSVMPSCVSIEGCTSCALDDSGRTCCSECDNGYALSDCSCAVGKLCLPSTS